MIGLTVAIAVVLMITAVVIRPGRALGLIVASMLVWPEYVRFEIGLCQMSVPRLVALGLVGRLTIGGRPREFRWRWCDTLVVCGWLWTVVATILAHAEQPEVVFQIGRGLDTVLFYFAARLALRNRGDFGDMILPVTISAAWMAVAGAVEAATSRCLYASFQSLSAVGFDWEKEPDYRWGLLRAQASTSHAIYFGTAMVLVAGILWSLRSVRRPAWIVVFGVLAAVFGVATSLSSGPQSALLLLVVCNIFQFRPGLIRPALIALLAASVFTEIVSNRHFFYVLIDFISIGSPNGWYRARLIDVAIQQVHEYALVGVGGQTLHWGPMIDGRQHTDVVNHFIIVAVYGGLLALAMYVAGHCLAVRDAVRAWKVIPKRDQTIAAGLAACLIALDAASMSVGLWGPALILSSMLPGMMVDLGPKLLAGAAAAPRAPQRPTRIRRLLVRPRPARG